jgi:hypothetical protein
MVKELSRLMIGLLLLGFHRQVANWVLRREQQLAAVMTSRGWQVPEFPSEETIHDVYFCLGLLICCFALIEIWVVL